VTDDVIALVLDHWPAEWCTTSDLSTRSSNSTGKQKKEEAWLKMQQLAEKQKKEIKEKERVEVERTMKEQEEERDFDRIQKSSSLQMEEEEQSE